MKILTETYKHLTLLDLETGIQRLRDSDLRFLEVCQAIVVKSPLGILKHALYPSVDLSKMMPSKRSGILRRSTIRIQDQFDELLQMFTLQCSTETGDECIRIRPLLFSDIPIQFSPNRVRNT